MGKLEGKIAWLLAAVSTEKRACIDWSGRLAQRAV
jgi:hypothetical protein